MSLHLYSEVQNCALPWQEKFVLMRLAFSATDQGLAVLPLEKLASDTSFLISEVKELLAQLVDKKIIEERSVSTRSPNGEITFDFAYQIYPLNLPKWTPKLRKELQGRDVYEH